MFHHTSSSTKYRGAVFFDADGTLVDGKSGIERPTEKTEEAIRKLKEQNYLVCLATGRARFYIPKGMPEFDGYITSNGAYAQVGDSVICSILIDDSILKDTIRFLESVGMNYVIEEPHTCYVRDPEETYYRKMVDNFKLNTEHFHPIGGRTNFHANKLMVTYDDPQKLVEFRRKFDGVYNISDHMGSQSCDVGIKGISKGVGVGKVVDSFKFSSGCTYAFGDADNDYEMFQTVGMGIAMAEHSEKLGTIAGYVTGSVKEDGIYSALSHLGLI